MDTTRTCPSCGKALPADAPQGVCPECLMKAGFGSAAGSADPASSRFVPPTVESVAKLFPQLEVIALIGQGGMGAVYKARQPALDRLVALKILPPRAGSDPGFAERFTREARALARLSHPNIVAVYDFGQAEALPYFVMEYIDGLNLRQLEQAGKLTPREAMQIIPQICEALQFAHDEGIVHRDIKPENVLLDKKGRVKIADFGLAKILGRDAKDPTLTGARDVMGTPHYMAPEQVEHPQAVDHRADIYSLGVVFYEMLTGELPLGRFQPPSRKVHMDIRLDEVVLHTLEKEPERRYQTARQIKGDVETIAHSPPQIPPPQPSAAPGGSLPEDERIRKQVKAPAIALAIAGGFNWVALPLVLLVMLPNFFHARETALRHAAVLNTPVLIPSNLVIILLLATPFFLCSFMIYAALKMMRFEAYGAAIAACIFAMLVTPGNFVGFPIGVWCLTVLARPEVREQFRKRKETLAAAGYPCAAQAGAWVWVATFAPVALALAAMLLTHRSSRTPSPLPPSASVPLPPAYHRVTTFTPADRPISDDFVLTKDNAWAFSCTTTQVFRMFEVTPPMPKLGFATSSKLIYQAKLKSEDLQGRAYLEMWCHFPGSGQLFSRGLADAMTGSNDWATYETPFSLQPGQPSPDVVKLNLVVEGKGTVLIKDVTLTASPDGLK